jgi:hypothetical protein
LALALKPYIDHWVGKLPADPIISRGGPMQMTEIRIPGGDLAERLGEMRVWLDEKHLEPSTFTCLREHGTLLVRVSFKAPAEARAFALKFGGKLGPVYGEAETAPR